MPKYYDLDQGSGHDTSNQSILHPAPEPRWGEAEFLEMAEASAGVIIDNGGSEVSALNDW
jgi:hypothetical protein